MDWKEKFAELELHSRLLEPGPADRGSFNEMAINYSESFLERLADGQTYIADEGHSKQLAEGIDESGAEMEQLLETLRNAVDTPGINPASGGHFGYIPGGGIYPSALGDFLADVSNRYSGVHFASPGAARMEKQLVAWMARLVGFPEGSGGDLTSGGSIANLSAIVTARDAKGVRSGDVTNSCVYMSRQVHHCVDKSLRVAGLDECLVRFVPMDDRHRIDVSVLDEMIRADRDKGLNPWMVVASAGTTDTGAVDPILKIAAIAENHGLWFHVDAAYGGFFLLCDEGREALVGLERADSIVMDPHKGLFLPYGTGAVLVRDEEQLANAHRYQADYMQDAHDGGSGYSPADLSAELSRPFRGLRLWLPLKLFGLAAFRAALSEKIWLARYFYEELSARDGFELGAYPDLSVVTFRYLPARGDADEFNRKLMQAVHDDGRVFISSTILNGQFTLRAAVLHLRSHKQEVDYLLNFLADTTSRLDSAGT